MDEGWAFLLYFAAIFVTQWVAWIPAAIFKTEKFYDLVGSLTYISVTAVALYDSFKRGVPQLGWAERCAAQNWEEGAPPPDCTVPRNPGVPVRTLVNACLIFLWAFRLGAFLFIRVRRHKGDTRFEEVVKQPLRFLIYWTVQGVWVSFTLSPQILTSLDGDQPEPGVRDYIGWGMWVIGFITEFVGDWQKFVFKEDPANKGRYISSGLWSVTQHPNYLGELIMWWGIFLACTPTFTMWYEWFTVISPLFLTLLLTKVSGIPILDKQAKERWGEEPEWQLYYKTTKKLIPFIW